MTDVGERKRISAIILQKKKKKRKNCGNLIAKIGRLKKKRKKNKIKLWQE